MVPVQEFFLPGCYAKNIPSFLDGFSIPPVIIESESNFSGPGTRAVAHRRQPQGLLFGLTVAQAVPWLGNRHVPPTYVHTTEPILA
jgi:hypothetical protein